MLYGSLGFESRPAPLLWFSPGKSRSRKALVQSFPSAAAGNISAQAAGDISAAAGVSALTTDEYCINTVDRILQNK
jgi:hypothetical protein